MRWLTAWLGCGLAIGLAACHPATASAPMPTPSDAPAALPTVAAVLVDTGWISKSQGLDRREVAVPFPALGFEERLVLFRVDPRWYDFQVLYTPGFSRRVSEWAPSAALVFNAGYFDEHDTATALVVSDGRQFGQSYVDFGGMFAVAEGVPSVRSLAAQPYRPDESLDQAVQGFPMMIYPDGSAFAKEDGARSRRSVIGQDSDGRIYVIIAPRMAFTLAELAAWLRDSDLGLALALNLDGGGSTGYDAGPNDVVDSLTPIPAVVAVYPRP